MTPPDRPPASGHVAQAATAWCRAGATRRRQACAFAAFTWLPMGLAAMWMEAFNPGLAAAVRALDVLLRAAKGDPLPLEPYGDLRIALADLEELR